MSIKVHLKYEIMERFNNFVNFHNTLVSSEIVTSMSHKANPPTFRHFRSEGLGVMKNT